MIITKQHIRNSKFWNHPKLLADSNKYFNRDNTEYKPRVTIKEVISIDANPNWTHPELTAEAVESVSPPRWNYPNIIEAYNEVNDHFFTLEEVKYLMKCSEVRIKNIVDVDEAKLAFLSFASLLIKLDNDKYKHLFELPNVKMQYFTDPQTQGQRFSNDLMNNKAKATSKLNSEHKLLIKYNEDDPSTLALKIFIRTKDQLNPATISEYQKSLKSA